MPFREHLVFIKKSCSNRGKVLTSFLLYPKIKIIQLKIYLIKQVLTVIKLHSSYDKFVKHMQSIQRIKIFSNIMHSPGKSKLQLCSVCQEIFTRAVKNHRNINVSRIFYGFKKGEHGICLAKASLTENIDEC